MEKMQRKRNALKGISFEVMTFMVLFPLKFLGKLLTKEIEVYK